MIRCFRIGETRAKTVVSSAMCCKAVSFDDQGVEEQDKQFHDRRTTLSGCGIVRPILIQAAGRLLGTQTLASWSTRLSDHLSRNHMDISVLPEPIRLTNEHP